MNTVGIIGGLGPESTVEYYRLILATFKQKCPDGSFPSIVINSVDMSKVLRLVTAGKLTELAEYLATEVQRLERAGASFGVISANTPHIVFDEVQRRSSLPLISIIQATCNTAQEMGLTKWGLFGTRFVMQGRFYAELFSKAGIELIVPSPADQDYIHQIYFAELVRGTVLAETYEKLLAIVERLKQQSEIQGLILGGTELSLIFRDPTAQGLPVLDTTRIHVDRIVAELLR